MNNFAFSGNMKQKKKKTPRRWRRLVIVLYTSWQNCVRQNGIAGER